MVWNPAQTTQDMLSGNQKTCTQDRANWELTTTAKSIQIYIRFIINNCLKFPGKRPHI